MLKNILIKTIYTITGFFTGILFAVEFIQGNI